MKKIFTLCAFISFLCFSFGLLAQTGNGKVSGTLVDQTTRQPVGFANIILLSGQDTTKIVTGAMANEKGGFVVEGIPFGSYIAKASLVGYRTKRLTTLTLSATNPTVNLGTIAFSPASTNLQAVEVTGQREMVSYGLDRKVVNVAADLTNIAGTGIDVMKNVPSVTVDVEGNVSMRGTGNLRILINGKPTGMLTSTPGQILEQIPASSIESVEVITNPSSRYDAEGEGGIINIILKKETQRGFHGQAAVNIATPYRLNTSLNLNYRYKKVNFYGSYDLRQERRTGYSRQTRFTQISSDVSNLNQTSTESRNGSVYTIKFGADLELNSSQTLSASFIYRNHYSLEGENLVNRITDANNSPRQYYFRSNDEREKEYNYDYVLGYRKTFAKKGRELTADFIYSPSNGLETQNFIQQNLESTPSPRIQKPRSFNYEDNYQVTGQIDFTNLIGEKGKFDAGYKSIITHRDGNYFIQKLNNDGINWLDVPNSTNHFVFDQGVHSLYSTYGNAINKTTFQVGGRVEYTDTRGTLKSNNRVAPDSTYLNFFPSVFITQELSKNDQIQVSYTRRINRPGFGNLNPFLDSISDPLTFQRGNSGLRPELANSFDLSQIHYGEKGSITATAFYRETNNAIQGYRLILDPNDPRINPNQVPRPANTPDITLITPINLGSRRAFGVEFTANRTLTNFWKVNGNVSGFRSQIRGGNSGTNLNNQNFSWTSRLNSTFSFWKGLDLQISGFYRSPIILAQGTQRAVYATEMALKKDILKQKGTINIRLTDIFNTVRFTTIQSGENFNSYNTTKLQTRFVFVGVTYRFGNLTGKRKQADDDEEDDVYEN